MAADFARRHFATAHEMCLTNLRRTKYLGVSENDFQLHKAMSVLAKLKPSSVIPRRSSSRFVLVLALAAGCQDPLRSEQIAALGPEEASIPIGPLHRTGQPCLLCHSEEGGSTPLTVAGTIYQTPSARSPAAGVAVALRDSARRSYVTYSNCAGNFYVSPAEFQPVMPLWVTIRAAELQVVMESPMNKDGDCATCHARSVSSQSAGPVFLSAIADSADPVNPASCKGTQP